MIHGYNENEILAIVGNMVLANNRLVIEVQLRDQQIAELKKQLEEFHFKESSDGRLGTPNTLKSVS